MADGTAVELRDALRRLAKAVVVITSRHEGRRYAMAATAVSELSMDPPSILVCVNQSSSLFAPLSVGADFCVNILDHSQRHISEACSGKVKGEARFAEGEWSTTNLLQLPQLADAQASFECRNVKRVDYGTHAVFIGDVVGVAISGDVGPLVYVDGRYAACGLEA